MSEELPPKPSPRRIFVSCAFGPPSFATNEQGFAQGYADVYFPEDLDAYALSARAALEQSALTFEDALRIARGCMDYLGGHHNEEQLDIFRHGIQTVINALTAAGKQGLSDTQVATLHAMGAAPPAPVPWAR